MKITRKAARAAGDDGFTLIEVLFAFVILAVGLLALQSLGVGAVRSVSLADRNTRAASTASELVEDAVAQLRNQELPAQLCQTLPNGDRLSRRVVIQSTNRRLVHVQVTVTPEPRGSTPRPFVLSSYALLANPVPTGEEPSGSSC